MPKTRVMIVEDEWVLSEHMKQSLCSHGYEVTSVQATGEAAIRAAEEDRPDLVLMDIMLRGDMNGIEAAREIYNRFSIPHIFITAYANDELLTMAKSSKLFAYLLKPIDDKELYSVIEVVLFNSRPHNHA